MATIGRMSEIVEQINKGLAESIADTMHESKGMFLQAIKEQLYSGLDSTDKYLNPNYDNDPFFDEDGEWKGRNEDYKAWKRTITPPDSGPLLHLDPRPDNVPNLFIDGTFYRDIKSGDLPDGVLFGVEATGDAPAIVDKWGDNILGIGPTGKAYFRDNVLIPSILKFYEKCGYR